MVQEHQVGRRTVADVCTALAVLALGCVTAIAGALLLGRALTRPAAPALDVVIGMGAAVVGIGVTLWWVAALVVTTVAGIRAARGNGRVDPGAGRPPGALSPAFMRRLVALLLSGHLMAGTLATGITTAVAAPALSAPAHATQGTAGRHAVGPLDRGIAAPGLEVLVGPPAPPVDPPVDPGFVPSAPAVSDGSLLVRRPSRIGDPSVGATATVVAGDSLWTITARQLGPLASDLEIARQWPRWYALNREQIGPDPDVLVPGQQLRAPAIALPEATG